MISFIILTVSCNKTTSDRDAITVLDKKNKVVDAGDLSGSTYPHSPKFMLTNVHGQAYREDSARCKTCHGDDFAGGESKKSCKDCHQNFPHTSEFLYKKTHGEAFLNSPKSCAQCHKDETYSSCKNCHQYPHPKKWSMKAAHGAKYVKGGSWVGCTTCHGEDSSFEDSSFKERHPDKFVACDSYHVQIPHNDSYKWMHAKDARSDQGKCESCHTDLTEHMPNFGDQGCYSCHRGDLKIHFVKED